MKQLITSRIIGYQGEQSYDFPTPKIDLEVHEYDEETDTELDEIDYYVVQIQCDEAMDEAKHLATEYGLSVAYEHNGHAYAQGRYMNGPFVIVFQDNDGYDCMLGISVYDNPDYYPDEDDDGNIAVESLVDMDDWYENYCDFVEYLCSGEKGTYIWSV